MKNPLDPVPDSLRETMEISRKIATSIQPLTQQRVVLQQIAESAHAGVPRIELSSPAIAAIKAFEKSALVSGLGEFAITASVPEYAFTSPVAEGLQQMSNTLSSVLTNAVRSMVSSAAAEIAVSFTSAVSGWLHTIDFTPLKNIISNLGDGELTKRYRELNEIYLNAMFEAKWFPYAGWIADAELFGEVNEILATSRAGKNRTRRIDKVLFAYYCKAEIEEIKRSWKKQGLPSYMTRVLVQSIQAYHRREYALTVSALSTLWEGIIQDKANDTSYRVSKKTRDNLNLLIEKNHFNVIFASFSDEFIFYDCNKAEDVKADVPGRHGIAHCWYNKYPSRKAALNAIIFTDFLLNLEPLDCE